jgi:hypothetical protein
VSSRHTADWLTSARQPARRPASGRPTLRSATLSVLGYTNNALSYSQKAAALREILAHAAAGRLTTDRETPPLDRAAAVAAVSGCTEWRSRLNTADLAHDPEVAGSSRRTDSTGSRFRAPVPSSEVVAVILWPGT